MTLREFREKAAAVAKIDPLWVADRRWTVVPVGRVLSAPSYAVRDDLPEEFFLAVGHLGGTIVWLWPHVKQVTVNIRMSNGSLGDRTGAWHYGADVPNAVRALLKPGDRHLLGVPFEIALIEDSIAFETALAAWQAEGGVLCDS